MLLRPLFLESSISFRFQLNDQSPFFAPEKMERCLLPAPNNADISGCWAMWRSSQPPVGLGVPGGREQPEWPSAPPLTNEKI